MTQATLTDERRQAIADTLAELDSHGVYSAPEGSTIDRLADLLAVPVSEFGGQTYNQVKRSIENRGLGGYLKPTNELLYTGHIVARRVAQLVLGTLELPSDRYFGRGTQFRADLAAIRGEGY